MLMKQNETLNDWLWQPVREWEVLEAAELGCSVFQLREQFLFLAGLKGPNKWIN